MIPNSPRHRLPGNRRLDPRLANAPTLGGGSFITGREPALGGARAHHPLIIHLDDDPTFLLLMEITLTRSTPYRPLSFTSSPPVLEHCTTIERPALIITDIIRPNDIDGITFCAHIRQDPRLLDVPLLILSACADGGQRSAHLSVSFVPKPCHTPTLVDEISRLVNERHLR